MRTLKFAVLLGFMASLFLAPATVFCEPRTNFDRAAIETDRLGREEKNVEKMILPKPKKKKGMIKKDGQLIDNYKNSTPEENQLSSDEQSPPVNHPSSKN